MRGRRIFASCGSSPWSACESLHHEPCHQACRVDAKKRTLGSSERNEEERTDWREQVSQLEANKLVFVDVCGSNIALTPGYVGAPKGQRAIGSVPRNRGKYTTLIASLSLQVIGASMIFEGSANISVF